MKPIRILFFGTPEFARFHLESLIKDERYEVVAVITQPDRPAGRKMQLQASPVCKLAEEFQLKVLKPESLKDEEALQQILAFEVDAVAVVAYGQIIPRKLLDHYPNKIVNVHGSLLPRWRGAAPIQRALMAGDLETGVSLQVMVFELDAGDVIAERKMELPENLNAVQLHDELKTLGAELLCNELFNYLQGELKVTAQDSSKVTHAAKIQKSETKINWSKSAIEIHNHIRGLAMGPFAWSELDGLKVKLHKSILVQAEGQPGQVLEASGDKLRVACGQGALDVLEIQPESKPRMDVKSFLLGREISKGAHFG